jgi:hypothetical protein
VSTGVESSNDGDLVRRSTDHSAYGTHYEAPTRHQNVHCSIFSAKSNCQGIQLAFIGYPNNAIGAGAIAMRLANPLSSNQNTTQSTPFAV